MWRYLASGLLATMLALGGCAERATDPPANRVTSADVRRDAGRAVDTTTQYLQQSKEEFQKDLEVRLRQMDVEIAKLRERGSELQADAKVKWEQKMDELETKREAARGKLAELRQSSAAAWKDLQAGAKSAWDEMDRAFREAAKEF